MTLDDYRRFYAEEIEQVAGLTSPALVEAFARVLREQFLGPPPWHISSGEARVMAIAGLGQPNYRATGDPRNPGDRVYHMGCGVDYNAILAETVERGCSVVAIDARPDLAPRARENLSGYAHVVVDTGDAAEFDPGACDAMLINAGVTHPQPIWLERLREGGRLFMPLTVAVSATIGNGIMLKFVRQYGDALRDPELEVPLRSRR